MTTTMLVFVVLAISGSVGFLAGWHLRGGTNLTAEEMREFLDPIANKDELSSAEQRLRAELHNSRRRAAPRPDAGPPSQVRKARTSRPYKWVNGERH